MDQDQAFETLLQFLKEGRGFDFTGYKRTSLARRVDRRMQQVGIGTYADYLDHLQVHQDEFTALFNTILINVTGFFRDPDAWQHLSDDLLPAVLTGPRDHEQIRVWSAGCASGEEACTIAMLLAEKLGRDQFRDRVKIYATDVDEEALAQARTAAYDERDVRAVPERLREHYFEREGDRYVFAKDLRRSVIFGRNDLVQDAPISRVDLLVCRNTLMYFNAETQARILNRFHFALNDGGVLFLGKAEMLLSRGDLFAPVDPKRRFFRKVPRAVSPAFTFAAEPAVGMPAPPLDADRLLFEGIVDAPVATVLLAADGTVATANRRAEELFGLSRRDVGRPFQDLELSYRPVELRGHIERVEAERRSVWLHDVEWARGAGDALHVDIQVAPLVDSAGAVFGTALYFVDATRYHRLQGDLEHANRQLETAYEELQSTVEELETTNEELQSTVEELQTTNEELQSTNEELETMNEELQSANDELQTMNDDLRERTREVDEANSFMESVLGSLHSAVVVVDRDLHVLAWNRRGVDLWGLQPKEAVGQHLLNLDIGLPTERLRPLVRGVLRDGEDTDAVTMEAVNRRGKGIRVRVTCSALRLGAGEPEGAIVVMDEAGPPDLTAAAQPSTSG